MEKVRDQPFVTFVGVPGSGKSAMAHHIALKFQEEGYEVIPVDEIQQIKQYCDIKNPQVFVIDDVVGVFGLHQSKLDVLLHYEENIARPCMKKSKTLMTCRKAVFNVINPSKPFLTKEETVINLHSTGNELDNNDKRQILKKYDLNVDIISPTVLTSTSNMFPLLCKLFSKEKKFRAFGSKFFRIPVPCIIDELDKMQKENKLNYTTLVLCMLNENRLSEDILKHGDENFVELKNKTLNNCRLKQSMDTYDFLDALSAMEGTYTKQCGMLYTFIHDSMFEIFAYHYGTQFPDQMLDYMSSGYIAMYIKLQTSASGIVNAEKRKGEQRDSQCHVRVGSSDNTKKGKDGGNDGKEINNENNSEKSFDLFITLSEDQYPLLAKRLYKDIQNMQLYDVFRNQVLKHPQLCQAFIGVLVSKSYKELKKLFLSNQGEVDKLVSRQECAVKEGREERDWGEGLRQEVLMDQRKKRDDKGEIVWSEYTFNARVISWVIFYGHHKIVQYIMLQAEQSSDESDLFRIAEKNAYQAKTGTFKWVGNHASIRSKKQKKVEKVERFRLLLLSCFSGDVETVKCILSLCKKEINGINLISSDVDWCRHLPLTAACENRCVDIVKELVKEGADVNLEDVDGNTPLTAACRGGHVGVVDVLLKAGVVANRHVSQGNSALTAACLGGHVSVVRKLVKHHVSVNQQDRWGSTPLIAGCRKGCVSVVQVLVKAGAHVNLQDENGYRPLTVACWEGHVSVVEELLKKRVKINLQDKWGSTPLIAACERGHVNVVEKMIKANADVNFEDSQVNTPLLLACKGKHVNVVTELVKAGAVVNPQSKWTTPLIAACEKGHASVVKELLKVGADVNLQNRKGDTPLIAACCGDNVSVVMELVKAEAVDVNLRSTCGDTPLKAACERGYVSVVEELVKAGAQVNLRSKCGDTPLIVACKRGYVSVVVELVNARADVNLEDRKGDIPLVAACWEGHVSVVETLVKAGADVNLQDRNGDIPLIAACYKGHVSVVMTLVKAKADVNQQDRDGDIPLIAACWEGHASVVKELVKARANVNLQSTKGDTPLIVACKGGHENVVVELIRADAIVNLKGRKGDVPLIVACKGGHENVVVELMKAGADINTQDKWGDTPQTAADHRGHINVLRAMNNFIE
jgi:ankyrin repeat protein